MRRDVVLSFAAVALLVADPAGAAPLQTRALLADDAGPLAADPFTLDASGFELSAEAATGLWVRDRLDRDFEVMRAYRPGYAFWRHIFMIPDGSVAFGSASDGRLLATFPVGGDWTRHGQLEDRSLATLLRGRNLPRRLNDRRDEVAGLFERAAGPVVHNPTRGDFLLPNARRYGGFLAEWAAMYERFGVPGEIGLAQAILESGLNGRVRSEARAIGFCQWLPRNWERMKRLAHHVIEGYNQSTQAPYCAAYLAVLATKYGTFIPALSEHHAGSVNVGRAVINGSRLGADNVREQYLKGAEFARDLRSLAPRTFRDVVRTYGPRSFLYTEMVFGNTLTVRELIESTPQEPVYAMRVPRSISLSEVSRKAGIGESEVRRYNPALVNQVPRGANLYLPRHVAELGPDVSFWHRAPDPAFAAVLYDFVRLETTPAEWDSPSFDAVLQNFARRFRETNSEEGHVMSAVLRYQMEERDMARRILEEYRTSPRILDLFERGVREREALLERTEP